MLKGALSAPVTPGAVTRNVYPFPGWSILRFENVATPFTAVTVFVPDSVPGTSKPPLCPIATVTAPVKPAIGLPEPSTAVTCTAGVIVKSGTVLLGWTVNVRYIGGLSTSSEASQVFGELKYQVHCGSTEPALPGTMYAASCLRYGSSPSPIWLKSEGIPRGTKALASVTPYASWPAVTASAPGSAVVGAELEPEAERCALSACAATAFTPVHAEIVTPPSVTGADRSAFTASI